MTTPLINTQTITIPPDSEDSDFEKRPLDEDNLIETERTVEIDGKLGTFDPGGKPNPIVVTAAVPGMQQPYDPIARSSSPFNDETDDDDYGDEETVVHKNTCTNTLSASRQKVVIVWDPIEPIIPLRQSYDLDDDTADALDPKAKSVTTIKYRKAIQQLRAAEKRDQKQKLVLQIQKQEIALLKEKLAACKKTSLKKAVPPLLPPNLHRFQLPSQGFFDKETSTIPSPPVMQRTLSPPPGFPALVTHPPPDSEPTLFATAPKGTSIGPAPHESFFQTPTPHIPITNSFNNNTNHTITELQKLDGHTPPQWQFIQERHFKTFSSKQIMKRWLIWWIQQSFDLACDQWELCIGG